MAGAVGYGGGVEGGMAWWWLLACVELDAVDADRFVEDFRDYLPEWYDQHAEDVRQMGGADLDTAVWSIDRSLVEEVVDAEEDPLGYDLSTTTLYRHPDVVWLGSDRMWYGAYEKASRRLLEITDFN